MPLQVTPRYRSDFIQSIAPDRLKPFRRAFGGDDTRAVKLYSLDVEVNAAMHQQLVILEVLLREAMHRELASLYGPTWFISEDSRFDDRTQKAIYLAKQKMPTRYSPGKLVAELQFGAWTNLLEPGGKRYDRKKVFQRQTDYDAEFWQPALQHAFKGLGTPTRTEIEQLAIRARWLRNRVAHCEPVVFGIPRHGQYTSGTPRQQIRTSPQLAVRELHLFIRHISPAVADMAEGDQQVIHLLDTPLAEVAIQSASRNPAWHIVH